MRVVVTFHPDCSADVNAWIARLPGSLEDRRALVRVAVDELKRELVRTLGRPLTAAERAGLKASLPLWTVHPTRDAIERRGHSNGTPIPSNAARKTNP